VQPRLRFYRLYRPCRLAWGALLWARARAVAEPPAVAVVEVVPLPPSRAEVVRQARVAEQPRVLTPLQAPVNPVQGPGQYQPQLWVGVEALPAGPGPLGPELANQARALQRLRLVTPTRRARRSRAPLLQALPPPGHPQQVGQNRHWLRQAKRVSLQHLRLQDLGHRRVGWSRHRQQVCRVSVQSPVPWQPAPQELVQQSELAMSQRVHQEQEAQ
jgi:hypothetical protein